MTATPQSNATLARIAGELASRDNFVICGHVSPDGDCIGSELALGAALRALGKNVVCLINGTDPVEAGLAFLPGSQQIVHVCDFEGPCDTFVAVDVPTIERLGEAAALHDAAALRITIDHHAVDTCMAELSYTDPDAAATACLVWEVCGLMGIERTRDIARCAYTGLMTDTGGFRFGNTDESVFRMAAEMVAAGADPEESAREAFQNRSLASFKLEAIAIERSELLCEGSAVISWLSRDDFDRFDAVKADAEPIINTLRSIRGVHVACVLREQDGYVRGSLRSDDGTDVAAIARRHNGGGHKAAAGFTLHTSLADGVDIMRAELESVVCSA